MFYQKKEIDQNSPGSKYLEENKYVLNLPRAKSDFPQRPRKFNYDSLSWVAGMKIASLVRGLKDYFSETIPNLSYLKPILNAKNTGRNRTALVLGNGPSQEFINLETLKKYLKQGNDLFVINFWHKNKALLSVAPTYLVISDPLTLNFTNSQGELLESNNELQNYLFEYKNTKVYCPLVRFLEISQRFGDYRVIGFVNSEMRFITNNTLPIFPRGYISMTLYKALALALWHNYDRVFVLGMDNTYPRNTYCDPDNRLIRHLVHAGADEQIIDIGGFYASMADRLIDYSYLFRDASYFSQNGKVINLDPYSLTDAFPKVASIDAIEESLLKPVTGS